MIALSIVVPCYNEESVLPATAQRLSGLIEDLRGRGILSPESRIYFVDDGSKDGTWASIERLSHQWPAVHGIKLSRNRGHQQALLAGLLTVPGEVVISIDADLQDDITAIEAMLAAYVDNHDIVFGVRRRREVDTPFKRFTAEGYYHLLRLMRVEVIFNHADFRLMSRRAIEALGEYHEVNLFLRGIIPQLGFRATTVFYDRAERMAGESKYPLRKMLSLAWEGITSFSTLPLRMITAVGGLVSLGSFMVTLWVLWVHFFTDQGVPGWASTALPIYFLGGIQLLSLGIIGEYLAKMYTEIKARPRYIIDKII